MGETVNVIVQALLLALVIRTLFFQPFSIPSGSMRPTLLEGDYLFVTKWAYGYSRHSLPFSPTSFRGRIWGSEPERGDVVVFKFPPNPSLDYIKRVIGLPGDRIQMQRRRFSSSTSKAVPREKVGQIDNPDITEVDRPVDVYRETLPNGVSYDTLDLTPNSHRRRHARIRGAGRPLFHDGRQSRQLDRQPLLRRLRAGGEPRWPRQHHLLLDRRRRQPAEIWKWPSLMRPSRLFDSSLSGTAHAAETADRRGAGRGARDRTGHAVQRP